MDVAAAYVDSLSVHEDVVDHPEPPGLHWVNCLRAYDMFLYIDEEGNEEQSDDQLQSRRHALKAVLQVRAHLCGVTCLK